MSAPTATRWIYAFDEGSRDLRELLGGKGANVAEMTRLLGPDRVPSGFTSAGHTFNRRTDAETLQRADSPAQIDSWNLTWVFFEKHLKP